MVNKAENPSCPQGRGSTGPWSFEDGDIGSGGLAEASGINCWGGGLGQEGMGDPYLEPYLRMGRRRGIWVGGGGEEEPGKFKMRRDRTWGPWGKQFREECKKHVR